MELFFSTIASFPTVVYTFFIFIVAIFWLVAAFGLLDIDVLDFGDTSTFGGDIDLHVDNLHTGWFAGFLMKLGLDLVPLTIVLTIFFLVGWTLCYFIQLLFLSLIPLSIFRIPLGFIVLLVTLYPSAYFTGWLCKPLRKAFKRLNEEQSATTAISLIGQTAIVRSGKVTATFGEAIYDDKGAGFILRIRADESLGLKSNDKVILIEYLEDGAYSVVSEDEFKGL